MIRDWENSYFPAEIRPTLTPLAHLISQEFIDANTKVLNEVVGYKVVKIREKSLNLFSDRMKELKQEKIKVRKKINKLKNREHQKAAITRLQTLRNQIEAKIRRERQRLKFEEMKRISICLTTNKHRCITIANIRPIPDCLV